jgi:hypothetical protein
MPRSRLEGRRAASSLTSMIWVVRLRFMASRLSGVVRSGPGEFASEAVGGAGDLGEHREADGEVFVPVVGDVDPGEQVARVDFAVGGRG